MAHMMKHTKASCGHMFAHFDRKAEHISNENLDRTKTHLNYNLAVHQEMNQGEFVKQRCSEVRCQNRKDVNVMVTWVVTAPKDLPITENKAFFQASYDFLQNRYGKENVISAYVHMDEVTPHMHFAFVPIVEDKKRGGYKVSAKECVNRHDLQSFHGDLQTFVERRLGHQVRILNEATQNGNRSIEELKRQSATERLRNATVKASKIVSNALTEAQRVEDSLIVLNAEYEAKKAYINKSDEVSQVSLMYPSEVKVTERGLIHKQKYVTVPAEMWEAKHVSANEKSSLKKATQTLEEKMQLYNKTASAQNLTELSKLCDELKRENNSQYAEISDLRNRLKLSENKTKHVIDKVNQVLNRLPEDVAEQFVDEFKAPKPRDIGFHMDF